MDYEDWMKASDYNNLRTAILNGHQHTGGSDGPQLNTASFESASITRNLFSTREKYLYARGFVYDVDNAAEVSPTYTSYIFGWGYNPPQSTQNISISASFPYPRDLVGTSIGVYLVVSNFSSSVTDLTMFGSASVKSIAPGTANLVWIAGTSFSLPRGQQIRLIGSATIPSLTQPAIISINTGTIQSTDLSNLHFDGLMITYTGRP